MRIKIMDKKLEKNLINREKMIDGIREEIIGPTINVQDGTLIDKDTTRKEIETLNFHRNYSDYYYDYAGRNEEIMVDNMPSRKYAAGLLYPQEGSIIKVLEDDEEELLLEINESDIINKGESTENLVESISDARKENMQTSMGFTFAVPNDVGELKIEFEAGHYSTHTTSKNVFNKNLQFTSTNYVIPWWARKTVKSKVIIDLARKEKLINQGICN